MKYFLLFASVFLCSAPVISDDNKGRAIGVTCAPCHGSDGVSSGAVPSLIVLTAEEIEQELLAFRSGERKATIMGRIAKGYDDAEIRAVAEYFEGLKKATAEGGSK